MALKTFNIDAETYKAYSEHCRESGISMSKQVENFIREELESIGKFGKIISIEKNNEKKKIDKEIKTGDHPLSKYC